MITSVTFGIDPTPPVSAPRGPTYADLLRTGVMTPDQVIDSINNPPYNPADDEYVARLKLGLDVGRALDAYMLNRKGGMR
jgi:hypothetical protein